MILRIKNSSKQDTKVTRLCDLTNVQYIQNNKHEKWIRIQVYWHMIEIPILRRLRQDNHEFETCLGCMVRPCLQSKTSIFSGYQGLIEGKNEKPLTDMWCLFEVKN